ncbi:MAG: MauE/DoxX family redox-associated membrane protein [Acidimicrobiales bacterium]
MAAPLDTVPYAAAGLLLAAGGLAKLRQPADTARALRSAGLPASPGAVRAGSAAEVALAVAAWTAPAATVAAVLLGASYVVFAAFVGLALRRRWPLATCGCLGRPDTPPTLAHVAIDAGAAAAALAWAVGGQGPVAAAIGDGGAGVVAALAITSAALALLGVLVTVAHPSRSR